MSILASIKDKLRGAKRSLTVWFNTVLGTVVLALPIATDTLPQLQAYLPPGVYRYLALALIVGNMALRFKTSLPLEHK
jgi:hypothetical protein